MMKSIATALIAVLSFGISFGQVDPKAKKILDQLSTQAKKYGVSKADITYAYVNKVKKSTQTQKSSITFKDNKYILIVDNEQIYCNGATVWKYSKNENEVEISDYVEDKSSINPKTIYDIYKKGFKMQYKREEKLGTSLCHVIELYPDNPRTKNYSILRLYIDKATTELKKFEQQNKNGTLESYTITKFQKNVSTFTDADFTFNPQNYPDIEINDLR